MPKNYGIVQQGSCSSFVDETVLSAEEAHKVALQNLKKLPGIINVRLAGSELIYFPLWTVHLEDAECKHKLEVCGVTGYIVFEESINKQAGS